MIFRFFIAILCFFSLLSLAEPSFALIQIDPNLKPDGLPTIEVADPNGTDNGKVTAVQSVAIFVGSLVNRGLIYLSSLAIILIIIAGANYSFSFGNPDRAENGKRGLIWTVIGLFVILFSYAIVQGVLQLIMKLS